MATGYNGSVTWTSASSGGQTFDFRVEWSETYDAAHNKSTVKMTGIYVKSSGTYGFTVWMDGKVSIAGTVLASATASGGQIGRYINSGNTWYELLRNGSSVTGSVDVIHDADGRKTSAVSIAANSFGSFFLVDSKYGGSWGITPSAKNITLYPIPVYKLSISAGTGSTVTVNRTSSGYASTGTITSGTTIYTGDVLKVTISLSPNYGIVSATYNGNVLTSGNSYTVSANANVNVTTQVLASTIGATDANIGSVSTITVTRYNSTYKHSIAYSFAGHTGYITAAGGTTSTETMLTALQIAFTVPTEWFAYIPSATSGTCTLTCKTYNSSGTSMGTKTASFTVTVSSASKPSVSGTVTDVNATTLHLTGDENKLIRYRSTARAAITATAKDSATITAKTVNGQPISTTKDFSAVETGSFAFAATDSRGYSSSATVSKTLIAYIPLSCNPIMQRPDPTSNSVTLRITGNIYRGNFGAYSNTLTLTWRYAEAGSGSWSSWQTLTASVSYSGNTYSVSSLTMPGTYDYTEAYDFEIRAQDGVTGYVLSTATTGVRVGAGIPVFDWGKNDFSVNGLLGYRAISREDLAPTADLNDKWKAGHYRCIMSADAQAIGNCPTNQAFILDVYSGRGNHELDESIVSGTYTNQRVEDIMGNVYIRRGWAVGVTEITWYAWEKQGGMIVDERTVTTTSTGYYRYPDYTRTAYQILSLTITESSSNRYAVSTAGTDQWIRVLNDNGTAAANLTVKIRAVFMRL